MLFVGGKMSHGFFSYQPWAWGFVSEWMPKMLSNAATGRKFFFPEILDRPNYSGDEMSSEFLVWLHFESEKDFLTVCQKALGGCRKHFLFHIPWRPTMWKGNIFSRPKLPSLKGRVRRKKFGNLTSTTFAHLFFFLLVASPRTKKTTQK